MSQLDDIAIGLREALDHARRIAASPAGDFTRRPQPDRWSAAECLQHLNLTSRAYLPKLDLALEQLQSSDARGFEPFGMEWIARLLAWTLTPPYRMRMPTTPNMLPKAIADPARVIADFTGLQELLQTFVASVRGYAIDRVRIVSPFSDRVRYNVYAALVLIEVHQRRHLWQAERALQGMRK